jgi:Phosphatidylserine decarboxylase
MTSYDDMTVRAASAKNRASGGHQLSADEPPAASAGESVFRPAQPDRGAALGRAAITVWRRFGDLNLGEAQTQRFTSLHACFTRELKPGARPIDRDPHIVTRPCDAIVGACGRIDRNELIQAKGFPYTLQDLKGSQLTPGKLGDLGNFSG